MNIVERTYVKNCEIYPDNPDEWLFKQKDNGEIVCRLDGYAVIKKEKLEDIKADILKITSQRDALAHLLITVTTDQDAMWAMGETFKASALSVIANCK